MTKIQSPLDPWGVIADAIDEVGGLNDAAEATGRTTMYLSQVRRQSSEAENRNLSYIDVRKLVAKGAMAPLHDLARLAKADLLAVGTVAAPINMHVGVANLAKEAGEAMATIGTALADGKITPNERADMTRELLEVQAAVTAMLLQLQTGVGG